MYFRWESVDPYTGDVNRINVIPAGDGSVHRQDDPFLYIPKEVITLKKSSYGTNEYFFGMSKTPQMSLGIDVDFIPDGDEYDPLYDALIEPRVDRSVTLTGNQFFDSIAYEAGTTIELWVKYASIGGTTWYRKFIGCHNDNVGDNYDSEKPTYDITIDAAARVTMEAVDFKQITKQLSTGISKVRSLWNYRFYSAALKEAWSCRQMSRSKDRYNEEYFNMALLNYTIIYYLTHAAEAIFYDMTRGVTGLFECTPNIKHYKQSYGMTDARGDEVENQRTYVIAYTTDWEGKVTGGLVDTNGKSSILTKYGNLYDMLCEYAETHFTTCTIMPTGIKTHGCLYPNTWGTIPIEKVRTLKQKLFPTSVKLGVILLSHWEFNELDDNEKIWHMRGASQKDSGYTLPVFINNVESIPDEFKSIRNYFAEYDATLNDYVVMSDGDNYRGHYGNLFYYDMNLAGPHAPDNNGDGFYQCHRRPKIMITDTLSSDDLTGGMSPIAWYNMENNFAGISKTPDSVLFIWALFGGLAVGSLSVFASLYKNRLSVLELDVLASDFVTDGLYGSPWYNPELGTIEFDCGQLKNRYKNMPLKWRIRNAELLHESGTVHLELIPEYADA